MGESNTKKYGAIFLAEFIGTGLLLFLGCLGCTAELGYFSEAFNFGLAVFVIMQGLSVVSGAHINPIITTAAMILELIHWKVSFLYYFAQLLGALFGYGILMVVTPDGISDTLDGKGSECVTLPYKIGEWRALLVEFIISSVLTLVFCSFADTRNATHIPSVGLRFGFTYFSLILAAGRLTDGSMNPVRSLAPAIYKSKYYGLWVYFLGPLVGCIATAFGYKCWFGKDFIQKQQAQEGID